MEDPCNPFALPGHPNHTTGQKMNDLCTEILLLVFEELDLPDKLALARVCRRFNEITMPIIYHTLPLERLLGEKTAQEILPGRQENAFTHTQRLLIGGGFKRDITPDDIKRFLSNSKKLQSVNYIYSPGRGEKPICPWKQIYDMGVYLREGNAKLYIDNFTPTNPIDEVWKDRGFPPVADIGKSLISLKMGHTHVPRSESSLQILKKLLLRTPLLEIFHYIDCRGPRVPARQFNFEEGQRLPPFKDLMLKNYDWKHNAEEVNLHWDFSRIRSLALLMIPVYKFLQSVPASELAQLQHLHAEDYSEPTEHLNPKLATEGLYALVKKHIKSLQTLNISCITQYFNIDALLVHAKSLTKLVFRDHSVSSNSRQHCPVLSAQSLGILSKSLTLLESLEIDMDHRTFPEACLLALCQFSRLHTLVLHTQTVIETDSNHRPGQDPDLTRAYDCFTMLVKKRLGPTKWQRVVINVGGWQARDANPRDGRENSEAYTYYGTCVSQRCFVLEASASGEMDRIYEEFSPIPLTLFHGNLKTGKRLPSNVETTKEKVHKARGSSS
ncbi:hypothetical protein B0T20DRAFT_262796 [Sordaria brevicollis]|uniref:F-box domain-containing protein n=1 Tax=Sordaria brevicollis TaxID=83679 RepID=A0AAE0PA08_SORBR|nr:hypothetical protein B0T20DRAFT_262796 [Sordaria brevicollis]